MHRAWTTVRRPSAEDLAGPTDVVHTIDMLPPPTRAPLVMTVHDALPLELPELYGPRFIQIARAARDAASRAQIIVATCAATAEQLANHGYAPAERIVVASPGPRPHTDTSTPPAIVPPYVLAVGSITPRKGFHVLAAAAQLLPRDAPPIIIAGPDGWRSEEVRRLIDELDITHRVRLLGRVDDAALDALYRHASALCHPSQAEGFGVPCLEAMAFGIPVVAADIPSVREIGAGAIDLVPSDDPAALAAALEAVLGDPAKQAAMSAAGRRRSSEFSWENMTARIVDAYRLAVS